MNLEKISDKGKNLPEKMPGAKKEVDPTKFRRYVEKVEETNPDERKKRRMGQEAEQENASTTSFQQKRPSRPNADKTAPQEKPQGDFGEHYETDGKESSSEAQGKNTKGTEKKDKASLIGLPEEKAIKKEVEKKEEFPFLEPTSKAKKAKKQGHAEKKQSKRPTQRTKQFDLKKEASLAKQAAKKNVEAKPAFEKPLFKEKTKAEEAKELQKEKKEQKDKEAIASKIESPEKMKELKDQKDKKTFDGISKGDEMQQITPAKPHEIDVGATADISKLPPKLQSEEVARLISHMVSQITAVAQKGEMHTTITLTGQAFQNSVFYGSQIVIKESPTAQRVYNIELYGATPEARTLFENYSGELLQTFQTRKYPFSVHRIETGNRGAIKRKKGPGKEKDMGS